MSPADKAALIEAIARCLAWTEAPQATRDSALSRARSVVNDLEQTNDRVHRLGWLFVDISEPEEAEA